MTRQAVAAVVMAIVVAISGTTYGVIRLLSLNSPAGNARVPGYHVMPSPAHSTKVVVDFAVPPHATKRPGTRAARPVPPFAECARTGQDCGQLIEVTNRGTLIDADPGVAPYDGSAATLVGVKNLSNGTVSSLRIEADAGVFAFANDGACGGRFPFFRPVHGCPFGPTGYEGPGTSFADLNSAGTTGTVSFSRPLAPGKTAWFSLAQALAASVVAGGGPSVAEQGGAPNATEHQAACSPLPVNCATGAMWQQFTDLSVPGLGVPLVLTRTYVSADRETDSPFGYGWTDDYAMRIVPGSAGTEVVIQEDGARVTFARNGEGGYTAPSRVLGTLTRESGGTFRFSRYGSRVQYHFDAGGRLTSEIDANGNVTRLEYNKNGTLHAVQAASGRALTFFYSGTGRVSRVINPLGHGETYKYDPSGNLTSAVNDMGDQWKFGYRHPATHLLTSIEEPNARAARYAAQYTAKVRYKKDRVTAVSEPGRGITTWSYSGNAASAEGGITTERSAGNSGKPHGAVTTYDFRAMELMAVTVGSGTPEAATTGYTYTIGTGGRNGGPAGLVYSVTDPELHVTTYGYDRYGNLTSVTNPLRYTIRYAFQEPGDENAGRWGEVTRVTMPGPDGLKDTYRYDPGNGDLLQATDGVGNRTTYLYGGPNDSELTTIAGPGGGLETMTYDSYGDMASDAIVTGNGTDTTTFTYNADGELTCVVPPGSGASCPNSGSGAHVQGTQSYTYNSAGEQVTSTGPAGGVTRVTYYPDGTVSAVAAPNGVVTAFTYNPAGEQTRETVRRLGGARTDVVTTLAYYGDGLLRYQTAGPDPASGADITTSDYDILGRLKQVTSASGYARTYTYGRDGELKTAAGSAGRISYAYDPAGELTGLRYNAAGTPAVTYTYYPDGEPRTMADGTGSTTYTYDSAGRLRRATHLGDWTSQYSYRYDDASDTVFLTYPNGKQARYTYDQAGQLIKVADWLGNTISFSYTPAGALNQEQFPGGMSATDQMAGDSGKSGDTLEVSRNGSARGFFTDYRDPEGRLTTVTTTALRGSNGSVPYSYYATGKLKSAGTARFAYDPAGGILVSATGGRQRFNAEGELEPAGGASYSYGKLGGLTKTVLPGEPAEHMSYNQIGELTRFSAGSATASYAYDGDGLLASRSAGTVTTDYTWDLAEPTPALLAAGTTSYIYGPKGQPVEQIRDGNPTYLIADQQGSIRLLTNESGTVTGSYSYSPYGKARYFCPDKRKTRCQTTALAFGGQYTDSLSHFIYLGERFYNPATAQFLTSGSPGTANAYSPYVFAADDPVNRTFTGLSWGPLAPHSSWWKWVALGVAAVAIGVGAVLTGGADLPLAGALGGAVGGVDAADAGLGVAEGAVEAGAEAGALPEESLAEGAGSAGNEPGLVNEEPPAEVAKCDTPSCQPDGEGTPPSCGRLSAQTSCLDLLRRAWLYYQLGSNTVNFLINSWHAGNTCSDPNTTAWQCANSALKALKNSIKAYETRRQL